MLLPYVSSLHSPKLMSISLYREIERLGARVKELEEQVKQYETREALASLPTPPLPIAEPAEASSHDSPWVTNEVPEETPGTRKYWEGLRIKDPGTNNTFYYGASSTLYFTARITGYLKQELRGLYDESRLQPSKASISFASPLSTLRKVDRCEFEYGEHTEVLAEDLPRIQEETFLNLFWQSYHCLYPIISETGFREHYETLWANLPPNRASTRRASPLVDIMLAICMQYGATFFNLRKETAAYKVDVDDDDASIAGRGFYARCQKLLSYDLERPSITTLQCYIFSVIYAWNASFLNTADNTLAIAIRTAHMLGLDHEPPTSLPPGDRAIHRRLWWVLYLLNSQLAIALGRPFLMHMPAINCEVLRDDEEQAVMASSSLTSEHTKINWLAYYMQSVKLMLAVRAVHAAFGEKTSSLIHTNDAKDMHEDPKLMESLANFLKKATRKIQDWVDKVPAELTNARKRSGEPFSTHRSEINIDLHSLLWLQRQRINLELLYHEQMMVLFRPFVRIPPVDVSMTPISDGHSISCLNHAMAITSIIYQVLCETHILNGCHWAYQIQWNATLSMLGFIIGNPLCPPTPSAYTALETAIAIFDMFGSNFAAAASAAHVTRDALVQATHLMNKLRSSVTPSSGHTTPSERLPSQPGTQPTSIQRQRPQPLQPQPLHLPFLQNYFIPQPLATPPPSGYASNFPSPLGLADSSAQGGLNMGGSSANQWPTSMAMELTADLFEACADLRSTSVSSAGFEPWGDFMADVQQMNLDQQVLRT